MNDDTFMLWEDNSKENIPYKIRLAARYFRDKYHEEANFCRVWIGALNGEESLMVDGMIVTEEKTTLKNHFELGVKHEHR